MIEKFRFFRRSRKETARFLDAFSTERSLKGFSSARGDSFEPEARLACSIVAELEKGRSRPRRRSTTPGIESISIMAMWERTSSSRDDRVDLPAVGSFWHGLGDHGLLPEHGRAGIREPLRRRTGNRGRPHHDDLRSWRGDSRRRRYNYVVRAIRAKDNELAYFAARFRNRVVDRSFVSCGREHRLRARRRRSGSVARVEVRRRSDGAQKVCAACRDHITNLVDVTMVLLIIFMLTAPFLQAGVKLRLPRLRRSRSRSRKG